MTLADGILTIRGEKKTARDERDKDKNWHVVERSYGSFSRAITLPFDPDPGEVEAKFDKGVLHIHLPKPDGQEAAKNRDQKSLEVRLSESIDRALWNATFHATCPKPTTVRRPSCF